MTESPPTITLFGHDTSPYVRRIRILLAELGLPFARDARGWNVPDAEVLHVLRTYPLDLTDRARATLRLRGNTKRARAKEGI